MAPFRRDGRLRPGTLWALFALALLAGAVAGWLYRAWRNPTLSQRARQLTKDAQRAAEKRTR